MDDNQLTKWGHYFFFGSVPLSNFYKKEFTYKGHLVSSSEQAYMIAKAEQFQDLTILAQLTNGPITPSHAKRLGRKVKPFRANEWSAISYGKMVEVLLSKFANDDELKQLLLDTGDLVLVEASPYDAIWGIKIGIEDLNKTQHLPTFKGLNLLGKALMDVRSELREAEQLK